MAEENKAENTVRSAEADVNISDATAADGAFENGGSCAEKPKKKSFWNENKIEVITAILLGMTALLTAWATWIGSLHGGIQAINFTKSNNTSSEAGTAYDYALQLFISDVMTWNKIVDYSFEMTLAEIDHDQKKMDLLKEKVQNYTKQNASDILTEGIDWMKESDAASPFEMPGIYEKYFGKANEMYDEAHELLKEGQNDNARGDAYNLATVLFSMVLFLLGIVGVFKRLPNRIMILTIAVVILAGATIYMLSIPLPTGFNVFSFFGLK